ncbi:proliferation marker protein Ki-67 isoform X1 [Sphaerodactylus townsendi]|uniref:proliferation marker protein Ki-67 isoform X1 n=1 Tax=Sphaerodactylus townsendi TaxID=933632 RepID=UPI002025EA78|nr:proliferation marker protein Ki-67 isoform X1 [Sphaerodactylus townsendi]XP_048361752.1 proliferation marker protein Ki-67 isoform X1 [Sphaerodactylus townsendi]
MPLFGKIVVIKRNGTDGTHFPLTVNSCTFGRKNECDIRIQLPQVSKEHCKIEVNENKEAILTNLSTVNPTQLNGCNFQQPVYLKHGDVLTIIDRSFRFEYPPGPLTKKKIARSEEKETLQVLHVQQVEQEELHPQNSEYGKLEWDDQKTNGSHEQKTQDDTTSQNCTNESTCKIRRSGRKPVQILPEKRKSGELGLSTHTLGRRKRVSFGGHLSPELFDKRLPPNSPLKRGAIPARFSLPFGNSPRAVLKSASGFKQCVIKGFSGKDQENALLRSPAASAPARRSPAASPPARRSPAASPCNFPHVRGRFSVSRIDDPSLSSVQQKVLEREMDVDKEIKTPEPSNQESKTVLSIRRSNKSAPKRMSLHRRSGAMDAIWAKRLRGASEANLIVLKSWAEIVKQGVPKLQQRTTSKCDLKRRPAKKKPIKALKSNAPIKTPTKKVKGYFTTGHANSPAPIVVGKAHTSKVKITAQVPKVMFNYVLKQEQDTNESFTGMTEMFHTPLNWKKGSSLSSVQNSNMSASEEASEICTPEESGEMTVSPLNPSIQQIYDTDDIESTVLRVMRTPKQKPEPMEAHSGVKRLLRTPKQQPEPMEALSGIELLKTPNQQPEPMEALSGIELLKTPNQQPEPMEVLSGIELRKTPKQTPEPVEALSGVKRLLKTPSKAESVKDDICSKALNIQRQLRTPKRKFEPVEESGIRELLRAPKQKPELVEALSGVKRLLKTPKQKPEPVEALSGVKRLLRTPKQKPEPVEALSGVKRLFRTPKQKPEPVEALSGIELLKTPNQKPEPVEALSGIRELLRVPKQKPELVEALSGVKRLLRTPKQKPEPVESLSGVKELFKTPKQKPEPVEVLSGVKELFKTPKQQPEPVESLSGVKELFKTPNQKPEPVEALSGVKRLLKTPSKAESVKDDICSKALNIQRQLRTPKRKFEPVEDMIGISRILKTPRQKFMPVDDYFGLQKLMAEPKPNSLSAEIDYTGVQELFGYGDGVRVSETVNDPLENSSSDFGCKGVPEGKESQQEMELEDSFERKSPNAMPRMPDDDGCGELQDYFRHASCSSLNDITRAHVETIETVQFVPEKNKSEGMNSQRGTIIDPIEESSARKEDPVEMNAEIPKSLASTKKPRKKKVGESSYTEEHDTTKTVRQTRNSSRAKLTICKQTNENFDQNTSETSLAKESESTPLAHKTETSESFREKSRKHSIETSRSMDLDNIKDTQELLGLSKEMSIKTDLSVNRRRVAAKRNREAEESLHLKENAAKQFISKTSLISRNQKSKDEPKSDFPKTNSQEKMQSPNLETSTKNSENQILKRNTRKATQIETEMEAADGEKHTSPKMCKMETMENHPTEVKEGAARRRKKGKVRFLLENETLEEKCMFEGMGVTQEQYNASFERITTPVQGSAQKNKRKGASVVSPSLCISFSSEKHALGEGSKGQGENFTLTNEDQASFAQGECSQEINCDENANETQMVPCRNMQISVEQNAPKRQKVAMKKNSPRRCRHRAVSHKPSPENGNKVTPETEKLSAGVKNAVPSQENLSKRGRGRRFAPVSETLGTLNVPKEDPSTGISGFPQGDLKDTQNEKNSNEVRKVCLDNKATAEHIPTKRQRVTRGNPLPRNGRSRKDNSHQPATENDNEEHTDVENQCKAVENDFTAEENKSKRGRRRKVAPVSQTLTVPEEGPLSSSSGDLQDTQTEKNSNEVQKVCLDNKVTAERILTKRQRVTRGNPLPQNGRSRKDVSHEPATEDDNKEHPDVENQCMVVENAFTAKENQPRRGRRRKIAPVSQTLTIPEEDPSTGSSGFPQGDLQVQTVCLDNTQAAAEHILTKRQKVARGNRLPQNSRNRQGISHEPATENDNKEHPDIENQDTVVENAFTAEKNQPKRGRRRKVVPVSETLETLTVPKESPLTGSSSFTQDDLRDTQNEKNVSEVQKVCLDNIQATSEHILTKRQRGTKGNLPQNGRNKQDVSCEPTTENDNKKPLNVENENTVVENAASAEENQPKRGRRRKVAPVSQTLETQVPKEGPLTGSSAFTQGDLRDIQNEKNVSEVQKVCLDNIQATSEHILTKRQRGTKGNLLQNGRNKQDVSCEPATENGNEKPLNVENENMVVENASTAEENQPKGGRRRKVAPVKQTQENLTISEDDTSTGRSSSAQEMCSEDTQNEENSYETQKVALDSIKSFVEHILPQRQKVARRYLPQRSRNKQVVSHESPTENDNKDIPDIENQDTIVKNGFTVKENQPKRGRGRKVGTVSQILESNSFPLSSKDKSAAAEQEEALEIATTANKNRSCRGRSRKTLITSPVPASKRLVSNVNKEEMASVLKDLTKENVSKRGERKPTSEASGETNTKQRATGSKPLPVKGEKMPANAIFESQSKKSQRKNIVLAFPAPCSPAIKITLPSSPLNKNETVIENPNLFIENDLTGKENLAINSIKNKVVSCSISVKRKHQEKQSVNKEEIVSNDKRSRRAQRKVGAYENDDNPKDQQVIMTSTMEHDPQDRKRILRGKNLPKHNDQTNNLEITLPQGKENASKRGRQKQVHTEPEMYGTISGTKKCFAETIITAPEAENTGNALQRGRRKKI